MNMINMNGWNSISKAFSIMHDVYKERMLSWNMKEIEESKI